MTGTGSPVIYTRYPHIPLLSRTEGICDGQLVAHGTNIEVSWIKRMFWRGHSVQDILSSYPKLTEGQVLFALNFKTRKSET